MCYSNEGGDYVNLNPKDRCLVNVQDSIVGSSYSHIALVLDVTNEDRMVCYEIMCGGTVKKVYKSAKFYQKKVAINITTNKYEKLMSFINYHCKNHTEFNVFSFLWNFFPVTRFCPIRGWGYYCVQFLADGFQQAGIIKMKNQYILTNGYVDNFCYWPLIVMIIIVSIILFVILIVSSLRLTILSAIILVLWSLLVTICFLLHCCCCFCPINHRKKKKRRIKIPPSYKLTPKMFWDIVISQNSSTSLILSTKTNMNEYKEQQDLESV